MNKPRNRLGVLLGGGLLVVALSGCGDLLEVEDPQRYASDDIDQALPSVAAGVEGDMQSTIAIYNVYAGLMSDVLQHTGTWTQYDDIDHGRIEYGVSPNSDVIFAALARVRWFASDAEERINRVLEGEAASSPLLAQVQVGGATASLLLGQAYCEAAAGPSEAAVSDLQILQQAVDQYTTALATAQASGASEYALVAYAGRARANLLLGNRAAAATDAAQLPDGWAYEAIHSVNSGSQNNSMVQLITHGNNTAAGLREKWWPAFDETAGALLDPWTGTPDPRLPIFFDGSLGVDGLTPHYSQDKFQDLDSNIPILDSEEMRLIEAEALWEAGDLAGAIAIMDGLRAAAGLGALPGTSDPDVVLDYLLSERLAEGFMEGLRAADLWRFGIVGEVFAAMNDPQRPATRPVKFPLDDGEAINNPNIENDAAVRCLPMS